LAALTKRLAIWLFMIAAILFLATLLVGGYRFGRGRRVG
jgi:hypothetical protein